MSDWYEYPTNWSNGSSVNGIGDFYAWVASTSPYFASAIVLMIWLVTFGLSSVAGSRKSVAVASFLSFVFAVYFSIAGMLNPVVPIALIILTIIGAMGSKGESY